MESFIPWILAGLLMPIVGWLIWYAMWRDDFEGIRSAWEYRRELRTRQPMSENEFVKEYYSASGIPRALVVQFRQVHAKFWEADARLLRPQDDLFRVNAGLDVGAQWLKTINEEFDVALTPQDVGTIPDGSFDTLLRLMAQKKQRPKGNNG